MFSSFKILFLSSTVKSPSGPTNIQIEFEFFKLKLLLLEFISPKIIFAFLYSLINSSNLIIS